MSEVIKLDNLLDKVKQLSADDGEFHEETTLLSVLDYLSLAGLPGASECYAREMAIQHPGAKISLPDSEGAGESTAADLLEQ